MPKQNIPLNEREAWSVAELASLHGTSPELIRAEIRKGKLKARKIGRRTIVTSEDRISWLRAAPLVGYVEPEQGPPPNLPGP